MRSHNTIQRITGKPKCNKEERTVFPTLLTRELLVFLDELLEGHGVFLSDGQIIQHSLHLCGELRATFALQL